MITKYGEFLLNIEDNISLQLAQPQVVLFAYLEFN